MKYSQLFIPTVKEVPAEAEIPSHQLMIRAGLIRKLASGTYTYLPLGWKCLLKIINIVREEMNAAGAQEILVPILQPIELWQQTGRDVDYGPNLCQFRDRHGRVNALAPTAEEVVTSLVAGEISSYKQLPVNLYQINTKFRDEFRPRFGVLRSREFMMKDAYSFHTGVEDLDIAYRRMYDAYCRIFTRCGLKYVVVEAESGPIGGSASHEFMVPCSMGEDIIVHTEDFSYAANIQRAEVDPPARKPARPQAAPAREEVHTPNVGSIEAVCSFLGTKPSEMIKTLVCWEPDEDLLRRCEDACKEATEHFGDFFALNEEIWARYGSWASREEYAEKLSQALEKRPDSAGIRLDAFLIAVRRYHELAAELCRCVAVALVRGDHEINEEKLRRVAGGRLVMAPEPVIRAATRAKLGFAGPMGLEKLVSRMVIDQSVAAMPVGVIGANRTDYHVRSVVPGRDFPLTGENTVVADIRNAREGDTHGGKRLKFSRGIEVGHVFKLGTKYSQSLGAKFLDESGASRPCVMGCYGIGINRILASAIEMDAGHDDDGCILPAGIAPFEVEVVPLNSDKPNVVAEAERIYRELKAAGADALLDDRDARPGVKFKDADLLGIPLRVVVGEKGLKDGKVEIKRRTDAKATLTPAGEAVATALAALNEMKQQVGGKR